MIIADQKSFLESHGISENGIKNIDIGNVPLFINLILSQLYRDPIKAFVREVASNARDANREVGKGNEPISIYLPTDFSPLLKISDNGPGISEKRITDIFSKLGNSTKKASNDFTGGFGLGSKTPWTYTDIFNINTIYEDNGKYINDVWVAPKQDGGKLFRLSSEDVTEKNSNPGTTIEIPIKKEDFQKVIEEVSSAMEFWECPPNVFPEKHSLIGSKNYIAKSNDWAIYNSKYYNGLIAIIDGIVYQINNRSAIRRDDKELYYVNNSIYNSNIALFFNNGELNLAISRDSLLFDEQTNNAITKKVKIFVKESFDFLKERIEQSSSYIEALNVLNEGQKNLSCISSDDSKFYWNNIELKQTLTSFDFNNIHCRIFSYSSFLSYKKNKNKAYNRSIKNIFINNTFNNKCIFYTTKEEINTDIIKYLLEEENYSEVILLHLPERDDKGEIISYDMKYFDIISPNKLDDVEIINESNTIRKKKISSSKDKSFLVGRELNYHFFEDKASLIENDGGIFTEIDSVNKKVIIGKYSFNGLALPHIIRKLIPDGAKVCGFTKRVIPHLSDDWISLEDWLKYSAKNYINSFDYNINKIFEYDSMYNIINEYKWKSLYNVINSLKNITSLNSDFLELSSKIKDSFSYKNDVTKFIYDLYQEDYLELVMPNYLPSSIEALYERIKEKYPLFFLLHEHGLIENDYKSVVDYIEMFSKK